MRITTKPCVFCQSTHVINVDRGRYEAWRAGLAYAQDLGLSLDEAELLISGTCGPCWDREMYDPDLEGLWDDE